MPELTRRAALRTAGAVGAALAGPGTAAGQSGGTRVETWAAGLHRPSSGTARGGFENETVRQVLHTSVGGTELRLRFSNPFVDGDAVLDRVTVGVRDEGAAVETGTLREVTFGGSAGVTVPGGGRVRSDPVDMEVEPDQDIAVSFFASGATGAVSVHSGGRDQAYLGVGDTAGDTGTTAFTELGSAYFLLDGASVVAPDATGTVVCFGDSITNGARSTMGANHTYPAYLARRINDKGIVQKSVVNAGINGNRLLHDSPDGWGFGPRALDRFQRDALEQTAVTDVIILEGVNDIIHPEIIDAVSDQSVTVDQLTGALEELATRCHDAGVRAICGTITPFSGDAAWSPSMEEKRTGVNEWIRSTDVFDATIDFAEILADPEYPSAMYPSYSADGLHPNDRGYRRMATKFHLAKLTAGYVPTTTTTTTTSTTTATTTAPPDTSTAPSTTTTEGGGGGSIPGFGVPAAVAGLGAGAAAAARRLHGERGGDGGDD
ncbi:MAG: SGNH/GDSL hydrolase family protein [Halobacteriaceae archaeon]